MKRLDVPIVSVARQSKEERRFVESVESFDQKVGLDCLVFTEKIDHATPGLPQSQITCNEDHHHNNANNIENIVHVSSSFLA
jgi:hypothetical protein